MSEIQKLNPADYGIRASIDEFRLEDEWQGHSQMVLNAGVLVAEKQKDFDVAKDLFERTKADLDFEIRRDPTAYNIGKMTETAVQSAMILHPEYKIASGQVIKTRYELQQAQAIANSLEHRKRALSMLVELWMHDYYSDSSPKSPSDVEFDKRAVRSRGRRRMEQDQEDSEG